MNNPQAPVVEIRTVSKSLPDGRALLTDISLEARAGESLALIGKSGSGKSTLLATLGLMDKFDSGIYMLNGRDTSKLSQSRIDDIRGSSVGFVFQRFSLIPHLSVMENVLAPLRQSSRRHRNGMRARALAELDAVGLADAWKKRPRQLSGGEQQRVAIARALIRRPALLLADEPTGSLDIETGAHVVGQMLDLVAQHLTCLIVVTHDIDVASKMQRIFELRRGGVSELTERPTNRLAAAAHLSERA
ncbi:MAG: transporter ATP-binding protein [Glaciihabitans sp.]|nr:transporter ATP-binding protein [Glaciihabitans sp.]